MERTVCLIQPDAIAEGKESTIIKSLEKAGFFVALRRTKRMSEDEIYTFLKPHEDKLYYHDLISLYLEGAVTALLLTKVGAVAELRTLAGPFDPEDARNTHPKSLRAMYGSALPRNAVYISPTPDQVEVDLASFFSDVVDPSPTPPADGRGFPASDYLLRTNLLPGLVEGVSQLCMHKPQDPYLWLSQWLLVHRPHQLHALPSPPTSSAVYNESVLAGYVLKSDIFARIHRLASEPVVEGGWNFRRAKTEAPIYGSGQGKKEAIINTIAMLREQYRNVVWVNMREEPVVFIKGVPHAPRYPDRLNDNVEHLYGISGGQLEAMERRLQLDVKEESGMKGGRFCAYWQLEDMQNEQREEVIGDDDVETLRDIYDKVAAIEGGVTYLRIPITDESAPEEKDFDELTHFLSNVDSRTAMVFNCQMGRGRTTTAMVVAALLWRIKHGKKTRTPPSINPSHPNYERGEFKPVIDLLGEMPNGRLVKQHLDEAIDECDKLQNLRQAIIQCKRAAERGGDEERPAAFWNARGSNYLHRYIYLIIYTAYLLEETPNGLQVTFSEWVNQRW
eukprot:CAMPEP_0113875690 /NCGR_PEP_ID=MMETSP0780_2-20120614/5081_1 /TAXON_ID=652834 /ORGANISM="Palpitomonas bilix" /LENGTH=560 /DNA_ID=CAMNT_0000861705 /DNA_START=62 /DNA_END=1741 /DNA_ORIENTATION=- /assembly_acc=CAM_ASM_000599